MKYGNLKRHIETIHTDQKHNKCNYCGNFFAQSYYLRQHIKKVHHEFKCDFCEKLFSTIGYLKEHIESIHGGPLDQNCYLCYKSFFTSGELTRHIKKAHRKNK